MLWSMIIIAGHNLNLTIRLRGPVFYEQIVKLIILVYIYRRPIA